jgi:hypothetical protein
MLFSKSLEEEQNLTDKHCWRFSSFQLTPAELSIPGETTATKCDLFFGSLNVDQQIT